MAEKMGEGEPVLGLVLMCSGWSRRFGRNKLMEELGGKPMSAYIFQTLSSLLFSQAGSGAHSEAVGSGLSPSRERGGVSFDIPLVVTRFPELRRLAERFCFRVIMHNDPEQSDTIRHALSSGPASRWDGAMFLAGDQPMLSERSLLRLASSFSFFPDKVSRLSFNGEAGNPVIFPKKYFPELRNLTGDHGGGVILKNGLIRPEEILLVQAEREFELWDVDTEDGIRRIEQVLRLRYG